LLTAFKRSPRRTILALAAIAALIGLAITAPFSTGFNGYGLVRASHTFSLSSDGPGRYLWAITSGSVAGDESVVEQRLLQFDRADRFELQLVEGLTDGSTINEGELLATFGSVQAPQRAATLEAERAVVLAKLELLQEGGHPDRIREARSEVALAQALLDGETAQLERTRGLAGDGVVSTEELDLAELEGAVRSLELALAQAELAVARDDARPQQLAAAEAELQAVETKIAAINQIVAANQITAPFTGVLSLGLNGNIVTLHDTGELYLRIPLPVSDRALLGVGDTVSFEGPSTMPAEVVAVSSFASLYMLQQVFWVSARLGGTAGLAPGVIGAVVVEETVD
jgi:hypothetical protein